MTLIQIKNTVLSDLNAFALSFTTKESLCRNPYYKLQFQCSQPHVDYDTIVGEGIGILIEKTDQSTRPFFAYAVAGHDKGQHNNDYVFEIELSTWLWFLTQNRNCRIFQDMNVLSIIEKVFSSYSVANYRMDIQGTYESREYCVQFAESDLNFVNRLLEDEGIWYYFEHEADKHTMVITDRQNFESLPANYTEIPYLPDGEENRSIREGIQRVARSRTVRPNEVVLRDYDYLTPQKNLQTKVEEANLGLKNTPLEWYDYATGYHDVGRGEHLAQVRLEEMQSNAHVIHGESNALGLLYNRSFTLTQHPDSNRNRTFKLLSCDYTFLQDGPDSSSNGRNILCEFQALNDDVSYRPLRLTPVPRMPGVQSATVVGAPNTEVYTDKYARIKVHFHWDRYSTTEADSSCWIRVVQAWAGKGWGMLAMPRVGQEVLVTYVDGDLDRPLVTGIVYNGDNPPPYQLPEQINYTGIVSRSLKLQKPQYTSQLTFDDKALNERVMLHAERDLQITVGRNMAVDVGNDLYVNVKDTTTIYSHNIIVHTDNLYTYATKGVGVRILRVDFNVANIQFNVAKVEFNALNTEFNLVKTIFNGVYTEFTGISTQFIGISTSAYGMRNELTGARLNAYGALTQVIGQKTEIVGDYERIIGFGADIASAYGRVIRADIMVADVQIKY